MESITPAQLTALREADGPDAAHIVDVREVNEVDEVRIADSVNIPMSVLLDRMDEVPKEGTVYVICHVGGRSAQVTQYLEDRGYDVVNVSGGMVEWEASGLPVERGR